MSEQTQTVRVRPWSHDQGEYVLIDAADYDAAVHTLHAPEADHPAANAANAANAATPAQALTAKRKR